MECAHCGHATEAKNRRILVQEIVADIDDQQHEIVLLIHWAGGRHSELRVRRTDQASTSAAQA
jgi:hypothetical protein